MADGNIRIKELEEITALTDNDYVATDNSASGGETKKFKLKRLSDAITDLAETTEEAIEDVVEETDDKFAEALAEGTANGSIASFTDGSTLPMRKLEVAIEPVQSGSGEPSPTNVRPISGWDECNVSVSGVNVWDEEWELGLINSNNGSDYPSNNNIRSKYIPIKSGNYYFKVPQNSFIFGYDKDKNYIGRVAGSGAYKNALMTITDTNCAFIRFYVDSTYGTTYNNDISINYPSTDTSYHAYNGQTYTIDLDGTRYGGKLDVVSGVLTVDRANVDYPNMDTTSGTAVTGGWRCNFPCPSDDANKGKWSIQTGAEPILSMFDGSAPLASGGVSKGYGANEYTIIVANATSKAEADTALKGLQLVYKLSTPQTIQLTPKQVTTLLGTNNVWADTGDILDATYVRNANITINDLIRRIEALENA